MKCLYGTYYNNVANNHLEATSDTLPIGILLLYVISCLTRRNFNVNGAILFTCIYFNYAKVVEISILYFLYCLSY